MGPVNATGSLKEHMSQKQLHLVAIGNAIVDIMCRCSNEQLSRICTSKGKLHFLRSSVEVARLLDLFPRRTEIAGGSAANTAVGVASFGGDAMFIGKIADDAFGRTFRHDVHGAGVEFSGVATSAFGAETSCSVILVTPDGQRTMFTMLGSGTDLDVGSIEPVCIDSAKCLYLEGYLLASPTAALAVDRALTLATKSGRLTVLSLSDPRCVATHRAAFKSLLRRGVDLLIANESEVKSLYQTTSFDAALKRVRIDTKRALLTQSEKGCVIVDNGKVVPIPAEPVSRIVDLTGAGDMFTAGVLYGLSIGHSLERSARLGCFAAAEVITQIGARPVVRFAHAANLRGLLGR